MNSTLWFVGVSLLYVAAGAFIVTLGLAVRVKARGVIATVCGGGILAALIPRALHLDSGARLLIGSTVASLVCGAAYLFALRPRMHWRDAKAGRELARQSLLHLVLVTGSAVFLVPFAWLVVTSLKEEEDMSKFPPIWIPRQQVKVSIAGSSAGLDRKS